MGNRKKMDRQERAKQFMPFAALKGYMEALQEKEKIIVSRKELSEECKEELDRTFQQIEKNDLVTIIYYHKGEYLKKTGMVSQIDLYARTIKIVNDKIFLEDIFRIEKEDSHIQRENPLVYS